MANNVKRLSLTGEKDFSDLILGIDLGTTNSAVAVYSNTAVPTLCPLGDEGRYTMQSCVKWEAPEVNGCKAWTVGEEAYKERYMPDVCYSVKRIMGSGENVTFVDRRNHDHKLTLTPAEVSSIILSELKRRAQESYPGVKRCIITVPAYFNQRQIEDTLTAAKLADLDCVQIFKEPTSASYIYSLLGYAKDGSVLVYDLGGGTFDVTHMLFVRRDRVPKTLLTSLKRQYGIDTMASQLENSPYYCRVLGTYGDTNLGGDDIDREFARLSVRAMKGLKLTDAEFEELILRCEQFKKNDYIGMDIHVGEHLIALSQERLNEAIRTVFLKTMQLLNQVPKEELQSVSTIVLVGGSTKSNYLVNLLQDAFPDKEISRVLDPDATVALGAGALAKDLQEGKEFLYQDVLPMPIGILVDETDVEVCVERNTAMPYSVTQEFVTLHDNQQAISVDVYQGISRKPEECTYLGKLRVTDLPEGPAGSVSVKVSFVLSAQGRLRVTTNINGVNRDVELVIDSIFNVGSREEGISVSNENSVNDEFTYDDFEKSIADLLVDNYPAQALVYERRARLEKGLEQEVSDIEERILNLL